MNNFFLCIFNLRFKKLNTSSPFISYIVSFSRTLTISQKIAEETVDKLCLSLPVLSLGP